MQEKYISKYILTTRYICNILYTRVQRWTITKERSQNTMNRRRKFLTYQQAKNFNTNYNFKTIQDYRQHVVDNNLNFLPLEPSNTYGRDGYKAYEFLGLDEVVYKANLQEVLSKNCAMMRSRITADSHIKRSATYKAKRSVTQKASLKPVETKVKSIVENLSTGLDPDKVIAFLIKEDVAPETIVNMVTELDIKSSTLMNDLCKYMHDRAKRQSNVWRPTGYTTAEAQMSLKV